MRRPPALLLAIAALALAAAGCGGGDDDGGGDGGGAPANQEPSGTGGAAPRAKTVTVTLRDTKFNPQTVTVSKGATVKWVNRDSVAHDVTKREGPGGDFTSGPPGGMQQGDTYSHKFATAGTFQYVCTVHPGMEGTVTVR